jgi:hypothetical protein
MIRVQVTERLIFEANELLDGINQNSMKKRPSFKDEDPLLGAIGEIAVIDYCWSNDLLAYKHQREQKRHPASLRPHDRSQSPKGDTTPEMHYRVNFASMSKQTEKSDFFFFTHLQFVAGTPECVWLLGGCSWDKFFRMATLHLKAIR